MEMHRLLAKANRIQDLFSSLGYEPIEFPKIVVVGPQSAGKSSVLESLVGKSFLPRGSGLVTRCPLVLQLHHTPYGSSRREGIYHYEEWGTFLHSGDRIFELEEICAEIEAQTSRLAGSNKGIVTTPITLKVFSPNVVNLTLVDLPGITKIPTGDQPADIEKQIERLIFDYIRNPLTIILAVVPANTDMANSESLKLAKEVDPNGERTLAVLTKIDLMDKGTDAKEILRGEVIPVKLGIVGVKNRSQQDIRDNLSVHESLESERRFFAENYKEFDSRTGSIYLARKLSGLLLDHINQCIPNIEARVREQREDCARRLEAYGEYPTDRAAALMRILTNFGHRFRSLSDEGCADLRNVVLSGGPKLAEILHSDLEKNMAKSDPCQFYSVNQVLTAIKKSNNLRPPYIVSKVAFEKLVKPLINDLERPALECVRAVKREISNMCQLSLPALAKRFPRLKQALVKVVNEMIDEKAEKAMGMIKDLVTVETGHITYYRIDDMVLKFIATYDDSEDSIPFRGGDPLEVAITIEERKHVIALGRMLHHYYNIVAATMQDTTVKAIVTFLVYAVRDSLAVELLSKLQADASNLFEETAEVAVSRQRTADELKALDEALDIIANLEI